MTWWGSLVRVQSRLPRALGSWFHVFLSLHHAVFRCVSRKKSPERNENSSRKTCFSFPVGRFSRKFPVVPHKVRMRCAIALLFRVLLRPGRVLQPARLAYHMQVGGYSRLHYIVTAGFRRPITRITRTRHAIPNSHYNDYFLLSVAESRSFLLIHKKVRLEPHFFLPFSR